MVDAACLRFQRPIDPGMSGHGPLSPDPRHRPGDENPALAADLLPGAVVLRVARTVDSTPPQALAIIASCAIAAIRAHVPDFSSPRCLAGVVALGLALVSTGCTASHEGLTGFQPSAEATTASPDAGAGQQLWWRITGDPALATLIERGLSTNPELVCDSISRLAKDQQAAAASRRLGNQIIRLFDAEAGSAEEGAGMARAYRHADRRARMAADIAAAYVEVRSLQQILALRKELLEQFKDNAEIAAFRREAGLVSGLDSGLAGSLVSVSASDLDALAGRIEAAIGDLARLTGMELQALEVQLGETGRVPHIAADVSGETRLSLAHRADLLALENSLIADMTRKKVTQRDLDAVLAGDANVPGDSPAAIAVAKYREVQAAAYDDLKQRRKAVADASARQAQLEKAGREARATVKDARLAYRNGTGAFTALYVAESAELAVNEAGIRARAALAVATVRLWTAEGGGWTIADLAPPPGAGVAPEVTVCE